MKTLPFDLGKALAGHPCVRRDGGVVDKVIRYGLYLLIYSSNGKTYSVYRDGTSGSISLPEDLFLIDTSNTMNKITSSIPIQKDTVEVGQFYKNKKTGFHYIVHKFTDVGITKYSLVCLEDGKSFAAPNRGLDGVFGGFYSYFVRVTNLFQVEPK